MAYLAVSDLETHLGRTFAVADSDTAEAAVAAAVDGDPAAVHVCAGDPRLEQHRGLSRHRG